MQIPVLIEPIASNGFQARAGEPFGLVAEGATPDEALAYLRQSVAQRVAAGAKVVPLDVPDTRHPRMRFAGTLKDDPLLEDWKRAMAEYRRLVEEDPEAP